jgi:hypothetical protein
MYHLLGGEVPPPAVDVLAGQIPPPRPLTHLNPYVSAGVGDTVMQALDMDSRKRPANASEFATRLKGSVATPPSPYLQPAPVRMSAAPAVIAPQAQSLYPTPQPFRPTPTPDLVLMRGNLDNAILRYMNAGYNLKSRTETSAMMERKKPINGIIITFWILLLWPVALIYALNRGTYNAQLNIQPDGRIDEIGGTLEKFETDKRRANITGLIMIGLLVLAFACMIFALSQ